MVRSMAVCRQMCWRSWEFYISIRRQPGGSDSTLGRAWALGDLKAHPTVMHFLQQSHTDTNKTTPPDSTMPHGPSVFKPPQHVKGLRQYGPFFMPFHSLKITVSRRTGSHGKHRYINLLGNRLALLAMSFDIVPSHVWGIHLSHVFSNS